MPFASKITPAKKPGINLYVYIPRPPGSEAVKALRGMPPTLKLYPRHNAPRVPEILDDKNALKSEAQIEPWRLRMDRLTLSPGGSD